MHNSLVANVPFRPKGNILSHAPRLYITATFTQGILAHICPFVSTLLVTL
jgi:hypothetical protein